MQIVSTVCRRLHRSYWSNRDGRGRSSAGQRRDSDTETCTRFATELPADIPTGTVPGAAELWLIGSDHSPHVRRPSLSRIGRSAIRGRRSKYKYPPPPSLHLSSPHRPSTVPGRRSVSAAFAHRSFYSTACAPLTLLSSAVRSLSCLRRATERQGLRATPISDRRQESGVLYRARASRPAFECDCACLRRRARALDHLSLTRVSLTSSIPISSITLTRRSRAFARDRNPDETARPLFDSSTIGGYQLSRIE